MAVTAQAFSHKRRPLGAGLALFLCAVKPGRRDGRRIRAGCREDHGRAWAGNGPRILAIIRILAIGLIRLTGINAIKETTEWIAGDRTPTLRFMAT
jgi:hypothetical protein